MRTAAALSILLCACSSLSSQERDQLASFQRRAKLYYEGNKLEQAMDQVERGLALDAEDYNLLVLQGAILLRASGNARSGDYRLLDEATTKLAAVFDMRRQTRHEPALLFHYALALQQQARRKLATAQDLLAKNDRKQEDIDGAAAARKAAAEQFGQANTMFATLQDRGELLRLCHYHQLLAARDLGDDAGIAAHEKAYLDQMKLDQAATQKAITDANEPGYEMLKRQELASLLREEIDVRSLLGDYHYRRGEADPKEYPIALEMLDRVLELDRKRSTDYYNRGRVHLQLGQDEAAKEDFKKFLATTDLPASSDKAIFAATAIAK